MKESCYFSAFEDEHDGELSLEELRDLKVLQNPVFDEPIYGQHAARQEQLLGQIFHSCCQDRTGLVGCGDVVKLFVKRGIIKEASFMDQKCTSKCLNERMKSSYMHNMHSELATGVRQRDVEDAFNMARRKHERKIHFDAFKRMLEILATKVYSECSKAQAFELLKARIVQPRHRLQKVNF